MTGFWIKCESPGAGGANDLFRKPAMGRVVAPSHKASTNMAAPPRRSAPSPSPAEMQTLLAQTGISLNPGQMGDLVLAWRQVAGLIAAIPRDRPLADDQAFVFRPPPPPTAPTRAAPAKPVRPKKKAPARKRPKTARARR